MSFSLHADIYNMTVEQVLKEGMVWNFLVQFVSDLLCQWQTGHERCQLFHDVLHVCLFSGTDPDAEGSMRSFLAHPYCRDFLKFERGKTYLIMGQTKTLPKIGGKYDVWKMILIWFMWKLTDTVLGAPVMRCLTIMHLHFEQKSYYGYLLYGCS